MRFDSNASAFTVNATLTLPYEEYETLMDIDGTSGFDLYAHDEKRKACPRRQTASRSSRRALLTP